MPIIFWPVCTWQGKQAGVAFLDVSTGEFLVAARRQGLCREIIAKLSTDGSFFPRIIRKNIAKYGAINAITTHRTSWIFTEDYGRETLLKHFDTLSLKGFGVEGMKEAVIAAGAVFHYLADTQHDKVQHINKIARIERDHFVWLDEFTIRNLELVQPLHDKGKSLMDVMDKTSSPMGSRLLRRWIIFPFKG